MNLQPRIHPFHSIHSLSSVRMFVLVGMLLLACTVVLPRSAHAAAGPDLVPTAFSAPDALNIRPVLGSIGRQISVTWTVANQGSDVANYPLDVVYLSTDATLSSDDSPIASFQPASVAPGASYNATVTAQLPDLAAGTYYLFLKIDFANRVIETDETNNLAPMRTITITRQQPADLTPTAFSAPDALNIRPVLGSIGRQFSVTWTVANQGSDVDSTHIDVVYLSTDATLSSNDSPIASFQPATAAPGASYNVTVMGQVPDLPAGTYYLFLKVDFANQVIETDETNNLAPMRTITITRQQPADLTPTAFTAPDMLNIRPVLGPSGRQISLSWTVANQGSDVDSYHLDVVYLSTDTVLSSNDSTIASFQPATVAPDKTYNATVTAQVPDLAAGTYYLFLKVDFANQVIETDETNNLAPMRTITITRQEPTDLVPTAFDAPAEATAGKQANVSWTVKNQGTDTANSHNDYVYLSTDAVLSLDDQVILNLGAPALAPGTSYNQTQMATLPNLAAGTYYLLLKVDGGNSVIETNKDNNVAPARAIAIKLANTAPTLMAGGPYSVEEGGTVAVAATGSDPDGDTLTYEWDLDNDGTFETSSQSATFSAANLDGPTSRTIAARVSDGKVSATAQVTVNVLNVAPSANFVTSSAVDEGSPLMLELKDQTDPSALDAEDLSYAFDCGDGYGDFSSSNSTSCPTSDDGTRTVRAKVRDHDGGETEYIAEVRVSNVAPTVTASFQQAQVSCGDNNASLSVGIADPGAGDTHTASVNWGDGSAPQDLGSVGREFTLQHTYTAAGKYNGTVTVTDDDAGVGEDSSNTVAVQYTIVGSGVQQPINQDGTSVFRYGRTVPVRVQVSDCDGSFRSTLAPTIKLKMISGATPGWEINEPESSSAADTNGIMRFSSTDNQYIYNLATKPLPDSTATYEITITIPATGQTIIARFGLRP